MHISTDRLVILKWILSIRTEPHTRRHVQPFPSYAVQRNPPPSLSFSFYLPPFSPFKLCRSSESPQTEDSSHCHFFPFSDSKEFLPKTHFKSISMDFEQYFAREWKSVASAATGSESFGGCFDCNICFDFAQEPVVTLCGHLYCWPCIYQWLHVQSASLSSDEHPQCPVCKADISHTTMVPLYGRGQAPAEAELERKQPCLGMAIPPRPSACGAQALVSSTPQTGQQRPYRNPYQNHNFNPEPYGSFEEASSSPLLNLGGTTATGIHPPFVGMFGEMVYARVFGNSENMYSYPNSYHLMGSSSPRLRRQEMQADKSLNRISIFLFCCFVLCLIVF